MRLFDLNLIFLVSKPDFLQLWLQWDQTPGPRIPNEVNLLNIYTLEKDFNHKQPEMIYEKKTGDCKIIEKSWEKKKKLSRATMTSKEKNS